MGNTKAPKQAPNRVTTAVPLNPKNPTGHSKTTLTKKN